MATLAAVPLMKSEKVGFARLRAVQRNPLGVRPLACMRKPPIDASAPAA